jgi:hypothetical protein
LENKISNFYGMKKTYRFNLYYFTAIMRGSLPIIMCVESSK